MEKSNKIISFVVIASFILSLAYSFYFKIKPSVDARAYDTIAQNISAGYGFRENTDRDILYDYSIVRAGPGYEYFLAGLYTMFKHNYEPVWIAQAFLHALSVYLIYLIARRIFLKTKKISPLLPLLFLPFGQT